MPECTDEPGGIDNETLASLGTGLAEVEKDGQKIKERTVQELIALDKHLAAKKAKCQSGNNAWGSVGMARAIPPDAAGTQ